MKTFAKLLLVAAVMFTSALSANAQDLVNGYFRRDGTYVAPYYRSSSGCSGYSSRDYVYRNPYAATPSVRVNDYFKTNGTYVAPHVRTAPNWTPTDNLSYRGYGTIRIPRGYGW